MKKKIFFTGSVFQFYVPEIEKFGFCKFFDFTHVDPLQGLLAQVYDHFAETESNNIDELKTKEWLFGRRIIFKWPNLKKDSNWKLLGILTSATDEVIPDFKATSAFPYVVEDESKLGRWYVVRNLKGGRDCTYDEVHHLETNIITSKPGLVNRAGMEYCRINNMPIKNYFDLEDQGCKMMYMQMINVPIYKTIPKELRGRAKNG